MEYKKTLNLPKTDFPMKAELPKREPELLKKWKETGVYEKLLKKNEGKPKFILHDGPPYANGHIHFGHILNKILKDIIVKFKNMSGRFSAFIPGWDCHGLPIELGAIRELAEKEKDPKKRTDPLVRREACRQYAGAFVRAQTEEFIRLGVFGDWEHPYLTMTNRYEADIAREFVKLYLNGYVYRGKKPVFWCPSCQTALAEAEVEYENHTSPSIYVKFQLPHIDKLDLPVKNKPVFFVIWTTTPWTLPANVALAVGAKYDYVALECDAEIYLVARDLKNSFLKAIDFIGNPAELKTWTGQELSDPGLCASHPFMARDSRIVPGEHVTLESGTGVVHIAPGHGQEDYEVGQKYRLETLCPVDAQGKFTSLSDAQYEEVKKWEGLFVKKADKQIVEFLFQKKFLLNEPGQTLTHSYPHCWRCKNPIIFRATEQWFCSLSHNDLRKKALNAVNCNVKWIPNWGQDRIYGMIETRPDWCLSRQRIWGVPIIVHRCADCGENLLDQKIGEYICDVFEKKGADAWWGDDKPLLPKGVRCSCGSEKMIKEGSILDVWFDSGVSFAAVCERHPQLGPQGDLYLEGSDQHRGWFHSSLLVSLATRGGAPAREVLTHGFVVDGEGKKYSKSAKNYVPPEKVLNEMGAELLRLWVAAEDYKNDIRVSGEIMKVLAEVYRKIRNTCRFMLGNLFDFKSASHRVPPEKRTELDRFALHLLARVVQKVEKAYETYEFHVVHHTLNKFFTVDLSAIYLDILKDRLYCDRADGVLRRSAQSSLYDILTSVAPLLAPILSFTAEEIWQFIPNREKLPESVFLASWPEEHPNWIDNNLETRWERIGTIRDEALKALEQARQKKAIGHPLDARVLLAGDAETLTFLKSYEADWPQIFITSQVEIRGRLDAFQIESKAVPSLKVAVEPAEGKKCGRCWNYSVETGCNKAHPTLCGRCVEAVR
ncbi:MAG: isoleucine--tRNA ligase [Deltaproteobacteria bacterium]|nr:isoleucine--tRNA ligase [Deltaproteobacteria bacterium]